MGKRKQKSAEIDSAELYRLADGMLACAHCLDGAQVEGCKHASDCDGYVMDNVIRGLDTTTELQKLGGEKVVQTVNSKITGFRCKNKLTGEYKGDVAVTLATHAMTLRYTVDVVTGRNEYRKDPEEID